MKLLTKQEEQAHYRATVQGGLLGGLTGIAVGVVGVLGASRRYHFVHNLTLPLKAFLVTSAGTFSGIISADHASRAYESARNPIDREFKEREVERHRADIAGKSFTQRAMDFGKKERYKIVGASWVASMATAWALVNRNKYLTGPQKLVQARVYAQFLTLGVLVASAAFEISDSKNDQGHWETIKYVDPKDPEHKRMLEKKELVGGEEQKSDGDDMWKEMVAAEEQRIKDKERGEKRLQREREAKNGKKPQKKDDKHDDKGDEKDKKDVNKTGDGADDKANTGGTGEYKGKDPAGKTKAVKGADEAKDKGDGEKTKDKK